MSKMQSRIKRKLRVRRKIRGDGARPRLCVFKSLSHIYAQVIDDDRGATLACASSMEKPMRDKLKELDKKAAAKEVGKIVADRCKGLGVKKVIFDRSGFRYIGRVAALADGAREGGLEF
jgi:large subunit ribosomal protein L18